MSTLDQSKLMGQEALEEERSLALTNSYKIAENPNEGAGGTFTSANMKGTKFNNLRNKFNQGTFAQSVIGMMDMRQSAGERGRFQEDNQSQVSEEEKEAIVYKRYIQQKKLKRIKESKKLQRSGNKRKSDSGALAGHELFMTLIKKQFEDISAKEEQLNNRSQELQKKNNEEKWQEKEERR